MQKIVNYMWNKQVAWKMQMDFKILAKKKLTQNTYFIHFPKHYPDLTTIFFVHKTSPAFYVCCINKWTKIHIRLDIIMKASTMNPDRTAPKRAVSSGSILFGSSLIWSNTVWEQSDLGAVWYECIVCEQSVLSPYRLGAVWSLPILFGSSLIRAHIVWE